jgi:hypothetical protein
VAPSRQFVQIEWTAGDPVRAYSRYGLRYGWIVAAGRLSFGHDSCARSHHGDDGSRSWVTEAGM